ncbi:hypothetical protein [Blastococcus sp. TF02A-26]|nr:hypothetical protein [Blastococcus sp. TF02A-26]
MSHPPSQPATQGRHRPRPDGLSPEALVAEIARRDAAARATRIAAR